MAGLVSNLLILCLVFASSLQAFKSPLSVFKRYKISKSQSDDCQESTRPVVPPDSVDFSLPVRMPRVTPQESDTYLCTSYRLPVDDEVYVVDFKPHANMDTVHHMLLFSCNVPSSSEDYWDCGSGTCSDEVSVLYAWARNAPPKSLPKGVGFRVGGVGSKYFVLQVHYGDNRAFSDHHEDCSGVTLQLTREKQPLIAGIYLLMSLNTVIPPGKKEIYADVACPYKKYPMYPFAYRVHTHHLGQVVSGYRVRDGQWTLIGRQSPQLPQAFYPVEHPLDVIYGDTLAARCVFTGEGRSKDTYIGGTANDEMCNLYIMYYMEAAHATSFMNCVQDGRPELFKNIPEEANIPIPVKPDIMMHHGHHHAGTGSAHGEGVLQQPKREEEVVFKQGDFYSLISKLLGEREDVVHVHKYNPTEKAGSDLVAEIANVVQKKDPGWLDARDRAGRADPVLVRDRIHKFHRLESTLRPAKDMLSMTQPAEPGAGGSWEKERTGGFHLEEDVDWQGVKLNLGQVSGLALDPNNNLVIFHRGDHIWDQNSFDRNFVYQQRGIGPIEQSTILVVDPSSSTILKSTGRDLFHMPHGLSIDKDGSYWLTDVALHQVFKLSADNGKSPLLILGKPFQPGSDRNHFCQPTDVAVDPITGNFYVADGYCNSRIIQFSPNGMFIMQWGAGSSSGVAKQFDIPHSLTLVPELAQLCVADRENARIQCFSSETGMFMKEIKHKSFGDEIFAISYSPVAGGVLYAVNGMMYHGVSTPVQGFVMNSSSGEIISTFVPVRKSFAMPHDIDASEDGVVYVGDANATTVWKFTPTEKAEHRSVKKAGLAIQEITETKIVETRVNNRPKLMESVKVQHKQKSAEQATGIGVSFVLISTLLIIPLVVLFAIAIFLRWRKVKIYGAETEHKHESSSGGLIGKLRGKGSGGLNLGNFFASQKRYSRKGFDRLSTEGSDQEKDEDDGTDSEEEYSAPPPPAPPVSSSS
uniref:Peptidyl-glycine alpha-amidating monooxygenase isoform X1 n=1 Tax=Geotrypetes seraphini TaxID=260995 RepID=A0A6P8P758_GEOSA|nr:peptidyl-glycine alpha-amidating monooxygenase isoform X1 [Geotrypetes seraphini]XP_033785072.1 peptidyl-glycine alpha-amidating monooxygenase isoform X1 [Geotrypetes seraphini]